MESFDRKFSAEGYKSYFAGTCLREACVHTCIQYDYHWVYILGVQMLGHQHDISY